MANGRRPRARQNTIGPTEDSEQIAFATWAERVGERRWPELAFWFHPPNGGLRGSKKARGVLKAMGTKRGVPDICLDVPRGGYHGARVELKVQAVKITATNGAVLRDTKAGSLSKEQRAFREHYRASGYAYHVAFGAQDAIDFVTAYMDGRIVRG